MRHLHVGVAIADDKGALEIEVVLASGLLKETGLGLAALAAILRTVHANVNAIDTCVRKP